MTKVTFDAYIRQNKVLCDGAFGTYYGALSGTEEPCEKANLENPELVKKIHREYIQAGARLIRTNTFAANREMLSVTKEQIKDIVKKAYALAKEAAEEEQKEIYIGGDIGPIPVEGMTEREKREEEYLEICRTFLEAGAEILIFETFSDMEEILPVIRKVKEEKKDVFIIVQFCK